VSLAKLGLVVLVGLPIIALGQEQPSSRPQEEQPSSRPQAQEAPSSSKLDEGQSSSSCINHIVFSQEFLARYPNAGGACREVKVEDGQKWARFDADVVRVRGRQVTANFVDRFDKSLGTLTFEASPEARVEVNGRDTRFSSLKPGDKLSFWMPENRVGMYAQPGAASESSKLALIDSEPVRR
jgi:hypothetical protein